MTKNYEKYLVKSSPNKVWAFSLQDHKWHWTFIVDSYYSPDQIVCQCFDCQREIRLGNPNPQNAKG